jgi:hypothetical protein
VAFRLGAVIELIALWRQAKSAECFRAAVAAVEQTLGCARTARSSPISAHYAAGTLGGDRAATGAARAAAREEWEWQHAMFFQGSTPSCAGAVRQLARRERLLARARAREAILVQRLAVLAAQQADMQM